MKLLAKILNISLDLALNSLHLMPFCVCPLSLILDAVVADALPIANDHVELGNLVGVLTRGWHFDRTLPVKITVAKCKSQLLYVNLAQ